MVARRSLCILALLLSVLTTAGGAASVTGGLEFANTITVDSQGTFSNLFLPAATLTLASPTQGNVRGEIRIQVPPTVKSTDWDGFISRAYLRARLPHGRLTLGKSPLSWGDGFFFNAAEIVGRRFEAYRPMAGSDSFWLASLYLPIGVFDFVEVVALPSLTGSDVGVASRLYLSLGALKAEAGYAYQESRHTPYVSLQGHLGATWWLSTSADVTKEVEELRLSAGLFHSFFLMAGGTISVRGEAMAIPIGKEGGLLLAIEGGYAPDQSQRLSLSSTYVARTEALVIGTGFTLIPLEALTLQATVSATFAMWSFEQAGLSLSSSWVF